ncbi:MAG: hypothetical protein HC913_23140 [Microscillaceae bacterium]|nr:hypothetical protein [Microscillaceae bacterium]
MKKNLYFLLFLFLKSAALFAQDKPLIPVYVFREASNKVTRANTIYFNGQKMFSLKSGEQVQFKLLSDGPLTVTVIQASTYTEPRTTDPNTKTVGISTGNAYYFKVDNAGNLTYYTDASEGEKALGKIGAGKAPTEIAENINTPVPGMSLDKRMIAIRQKAVIQRDEIEKKEKELKTQIDTYFAELKKSAQLSRAVQPTFEVEVEEAEVIEGRPTYNLRTVFSYEVQEEFQVELINYPSGGYLYDSSPAARAITNAAKLTIDKYLYEYLEPGSQVAIQIIGSADATPIRGGFPYKGEFGDLDQQRYYIAESFDLSQVAANFEAREGGGGGTTPASSFASKSLDLKKGGLITENETLAFLRSYGIRFFMQNNIDRMKQVKVRFSHFSKVALESGAKFRKVTIQMLIEDVFRDK